MTNKCYLFLVFPDDEKALTTYAHKAQKQILSKIDVIPDTIPEELFVFDEKDKSASKRTVKVTERARQSKEQELLEPVTKKPKNKPETSSRVTAKSPTAQLEPVAKKPKSKKKTTDPNNLDAAEILNAIETNNNKSAKSFIAPEIISPVTSHSSYDEKSEPVAKKPKSKKKTTDTHNIDAIEIVDTIESKNNKSATSIAPEISPQLTGHCSHEDKAESLPDKNNNIVVDLSDSSALVQNSWKILQDTSVSPSVAEPVRFSRMYT